VGIYLPGDISDPEFTMTVILDPALEDVV